MEDLLTQLANKNSQTAACKTFARFNFIVGSPLLIF